jgi:hypothetical protein
VGKTLKIIIKRKWFCDILSGVKTEEYREVKPFWVDRLIDKEYDFIEFINGYSADAPRAVYKYGGYKIRNITHEFFGDDEISVFAIQIGRRIN